MDGRTWAVSAILAVAAVSGGMAQGVQWNGFSLTGSLQSDILVPQDDASIGTEPYAGDVVTNTYLNLALSYKEYVTVGARLEYLDYPLPGFERDFAGSRLCRLGCSQHICDGTLQMGGGDCG